MMTLIGPLVAPEGTAAVIEVLEVTVRVPAAFPLNLTVARPSRKPVPVIVTDVPAVPLAGEKLVTVTSGDTLKLRVLLPLPASVVTEIGPLVAPGGTNAVIEVLLVTLRTTATVPLNLTFAPLAKPVPVIVMPDPTGAPPAGEKLVTVGAGGIVKLALLVAVPALVVTVIGPLVAPDGTSATMSVLLPGNVPATVPLNFTVTPTLLIGKPVPWIVTVVLGRPLVG
jgi:hypothetical protein